MYIPNLISNIVLTVKFFFKVFKIEIELLLPVSPPPVLCIDTNMCIYTHIFIYIFICIRIIQILLYHILHNSCFTLLLYFKVISFYYISKLGKNIFFFLFSMLRNSHRNFQRFYIRHSYRVIGFCSAYKLFMKLIC